MNMTISFNDWLKGTKHTDPRFTELSATWEIKRGRPTRASIERRAPGVGGMAWDAYQASCLPSSSPIPTQPNLKATTNE